MCLVVRSGKVSISQTFPFIFWKSFQFKLLVSIQLNFGFCFQLFAENLVHQTPSQNCFIYKSNDTLTQLTQPSAERIGTSRNNISLNIYIKAQSVSLPDKTQCFLISAFFLGAPVFSKIPMNNWLAKYQYCLVDKIYSGYYIHSFSHYY